MIIEVNSLEDTKKLAEQMARLLHGGDTVAFEGGMGAGKTTFTGFLMEALGYTGEVYSPSYALVNTYKAPHFTVEHYDMYRIDSTDDLYSTGFFDELGGEKLLLIEWSEKVSEDLPKGCIRIAITPLSETRRQIIIEGDERF